MQPHKAESHCSVSVKHQTCLEFKLQCSCAARQAEEAGGGPFAKAEMQIEVAKQVIIAASPSDLGQLLVYICGGFNGNECLFTAEAYDAKTNQWTLIAPMRSRRSGIGVIAYGEHVYAPMLGSMLPDETTLQDYHSEMKSNTPLRQVPYLYE
ncbi:mucin-19-like [Platysternon megacephalum]|uniref:Mucin-19-like n=1 Tax=Platysternon megacephalum TaxID=55544 RepID=A0A4D9EHW2_9SAUR|nr:mucin-19-like [Platysternon megacephalum]